MCNMGNLEFEKGLAISAAKATPLNIIRGVDSDDLLYNYPLG